MTGSASYWIKRIGLAVMGQALPETSALSGLVRDVRRGLLATVVTGVLVAALVILGCFGFYHALVSQGLSPLAASGLGAGFLLLIAVITGLVADKYLSKTEKAKEKLALFPEDKVESATREPVNLESVLVAFVEGLCGEEPDHTQHNAPHIAVDTMQSFDGEPYTNGSHYTYTAHLHEGKAIHH